MPDYFDLFNDITDGEVDKLYESRRRFNAMKPVRDSVWKNEEIDICRTKFHHVNKRYGWQKKNTIQIVIQKDKVKRKDSASVTEMDRRVIDSIIKRYNIED